MPKDVLLYGDIYSETAKKFFEAIGEIEEESGESSEFNFRINTYGGEPRFMMGVLNKLNELKHKTGVVDGMAYSAGAFACALIENVKAVEGSQFLIHRAAMWCEKYPEMFTDSLKKELDEVNKNLRKWIEAKIDVAKFEKIAKRTMDEIFSMDSRIDVMLTAKQAQSIGLIEEIVPLTLKRRKNINALIETVHEEEFRIAAKKIVAGDPDEDEEESKPAKSKPMTIEKIKAEYPELYAQIVAQGHAAGVTAERDRANAWLAYAEIDAKKALEGAKGDKPVTQSIMAEFQVAGLSAARLNALKSDTAGKIEAGEGSEGKEQTEKEKELSAAQAKIDAALGRKPKAA